MFNEEYIPWSLDISNSFVDLKAFWKYPRSSENAVAIWYFHVHVKGTPLITHMKRDITFTESLITFEKIEIRRAQ